MVDFKEFILAIHLMSFGSPEEKLLSEVEILRFLLWGMRVIVMRLMLLASLCGAAPVNINCDNCKIDIGDTEEVIDNEVQFGDLSNSLIDMSFGDVIVRDNRAFHMQVGDLLNSPIDMSFGDVIVRDNRAFHLQTGDLLNSPINMIFGDFIMRENTDDVHGQDGGWSDYGPCTKFCGGGMKERSCSNPAPAGGGQLCRGSATARCNTRPCAGVSHQEAIEILKTTIQTIEDGLGDLEKNSRSKRDLDIFSENEWKLLEVISEVTVYISNECSIRQSQCQLKTVETFVEMLTTTFNKIKSTGNCSPGFVERVEERKKTFYSVATVVEQALTETRRKEGEICGPCNCPPTYSAGDCAPGLICQKDEMKPYLAGVCTRAEHLNPKKEGEKCGPCNCPPSYTAGHCQPELDCEKDPMNPDKPGVCKRPKAPDLCFGRLCGEQCDSSSGMLQVVRYCQPDGSCGTDARPTCPEVPRKREGESCGSAGGCAEGLSCEKDERIPNAPGICTRPCLQRFALAGPCRASMPRWSYKQATGRCEPFIYGGCSGNDNRFRRYQECSDHCKTPGF